MGLGLGLECWPPKGKRRGADPGKWVLAFVFDLIISLGEGFRAKKCGSYLDRFASNQVTLHEFMDGAVGAAQMNTVAVVQQRGDLIEDIEWKGVEG